MKAARDFAIQRFAQDLVESVDNFDRALSMVPEEKLKTPAEGQEKTEHQQDLVNLYEGLKMTETILLQTLKKHGLERFDPNGLVFNPNEHEATFMTPMPDKEHNTVFHVQQKGFKLNGRVLRPAKVGVVKNK
jgi:molecular chaperone GrpE